MRSNTIWSEITKVSTTSCSSQCKKVEGPRIAVRCREPSWRNAPILPITRQHKPSGRPSFSEDVIHPAKTCHSRGRSHACRRSTYAPKCTLGRRFGDGGWKGHLSLFRPVTAGGRELEPRRSRHSQGLRNLQTLDAGTIVRNLLRKDVPLTRGLAIGEPRPLPQVRERYNIFIRLSVRPWPHEGLS